MREGREEVWEAAEVVCSVRMVVLWAMQELGREGGTRDVSDGLGKSFGGFRG